MWLKKISIPTYWMMGVKFQGEGIVKVKRAMHVPKLHFPGRGWGGGDLKGGKGVSNQTTLHRKFMLFFWNNTF